MIEEKKCTKCNQNKHYNLFYKHKITHVENNLQVITASENNQKSNKFEPKLGI